MNVLNQESEENIKIFDTCVEVTIKLSIFTSSRDDARLSGETLGSIR
jgi:hypothetical protein